MWDFSIFATGDAWAALLTLTLMEVVLGIDNIVFLSIASDRLPPAEQARARQLGLALALLMRVGLLFAISWVMGLDSELFAVFGQSVSGRDLILLVGGLFLIAKASHEIFDKLEMPRAEDGEGGGKAVSFAGVIAQIVVLDIVFSLDSVITAVGMAKHLLVMVIAVVIAIVIMMAFAGSISDFVNRRPSMKILALSFLLLIGVMLVAEGLGQHIEKGYIYFAMAFALLVELINMRVRKNQQPVELGGRYERSHEPAGATESSA